MQANFRKSEQGQILVILVLALLGLLAFTALAIDLGMVFSDRRYDQNVADASALAAAEKAAEAIKKNQYLNKDNVVVTGIGYDGFSCGTSANQWSDVNGWKAPDFLSPSDSLSRPVLASSIMQAAYDRALTNNMALKINDISDQNGVVMRCVDTGDGTKYLEFRVMVSGVTNQSFAYHVFGGVLRNTVEAVSHVEGSSPLGFDNAVLALNNTLDCQHTNVGSILFDGGPSVVVEGGSITSNRCMKTTAGNAYIRVLDPTYSPPDCVDENADTIRFMFTTGQKINADVCPIPQQMTNPVPRQLFDAMPCDKLPNAKNPVTFRLNTNSSDPVIIQPDVYKSITVTNGNLTLAPGLYCIQGDFKFNGGDLTTTTDAVSGGDFGCLEDDTKCGVTIWMDSKNGNFSLAGNGKMTLTAPMSKTNEWQYSKNYLLLGGPDSYAGTVDIEGNQDDVFIGAIYVPYAELLIGGTSNAGTSDPESSQGPRFTQLIADRIKFHGSTTINIVYDSSKQLSGLPSLYLAK